MIRVPSDEVLAAVLKHQESAFEIDDEDVLPHMTSCAGQFLLQVWLPSWVLHREYPTRLFALASEGDVDALVALVELDKCAILAPELAPHWDHAMREAPDGVRRRCLAALARESLEAPTTSETRAGLGRLIRELAPFCSCKISAPEIGRLFHAVRMVKAAQATHRPVPIIEPKSHKPGPRITHRTDRPPPATPHSLRPLSLPCANPIDPPPRIVGPAPPVPLDSTALLPARAGVSRPGTRPRYESTEEAQPLLGARPLLLIGSGDRIRTCDLRVMSPTSYQTAPPRDTGGRDCRGQTMGVNGRSRSIRDSLDRIAAQASGPTVDSAWNRPLGPWNR